MRHPPAVDRDYPSLMQNVEECLFEPASEIDSPVGLRSRVASRPMIVPVTLHSCSRSSARCLSSLHERVLGAIH
jgi:hypothetical protein